MDRAKGYHTGFSETRTLARHRAVITASLLLTILLVAPAAQAEDRAICAVCGPREGAGFEPVKATATYKGKTYYFCSVKCKVEFLKDPDQFLVTDTGTPAPPFSLKTFDGAEVSLAGLRGNVILLDFWATYCAPCITALPHLQDLHAKYSGRGLAVVGLTVDDRPALVKRASTAAKVTYPLLRSTADVWNAYKVHSLPSLVLISRDGTIIRRFGGEADRTMMIAEIERALAAAR